MSEWLIIITLAVMRFTYSSLVEAFVTWGMFKLILPDTYDIKYWICFVFWYVIGFIVAVTKFKKIIK